MPCGFNGKTFAIACATFTGMFLLTCVHDYNPFDDYANAQAGILFSACSKNIRDGNALDIFTSETLAIYTAVREKIDSVKVHAGAINRYWSDTTFAPPFKDSMVLLLSFWDTGSAAITISTYRSNQTVASLPAPLIFRVRSTLKQDPLMAVFNSPCTLSTPALGDNSDLLYVWLFGKDTVVGIASNTYSNFWGKLPHLEIGKTDTGFLWVEDFKHKHFSPVTTFTYLFQKPAPPSIVCVNPGSQGDTVVTGDTTFTFKFQIIDSSGQGLDSVDVSGERPQVSNDGTFFVNISGMGQYSAANPEIKIVTAINKMGYTAIDTFYLSYAHSAPHNSDLIAFTLINPSTPTLTTGLDSFSYAVTVSNYSQNPAFVVSTVTGPDGKSVTLPMIGFSGVNDTCRWTVPLEVGSDTILTLASIPQRNFVAETTVVLRRAVNIVDTTRPQITAIYVNDSLFPLARDSTWVMPIDSPNVVVKVFAEDNESGIDTVTITDTSNIALAIAMTKDSNRIDWQSAPIAFGSPGSIMTLRITVKSKSLAPTNTTARTIRLSNIVSAGSQPPSIVTQPLSQTVMAGQRVTFSVTAIGTLPLSYEWFKNGNPISGADSSNLTLSNVQQSDTATYSVLVSNGTKPNALSSGAVLVVSAIPVAPSITTQPKSQTITAGQSAAFSVTASGTPPLLYQWYKNGTAISGATALSYTVSNVQAANAGTYTVIVSNGTFPNDTSLGAVLTVSALPVAPSISVQPKSNTLTAGQNDTLSVTATGTAPLSYQWYKNGAAISGATSSSYMLLNVQPANAGTYTVIVSNGTLPNATSSGAVLTVNVPPGITTQPKSVALTLGQNDTLSVTATGTAPLSYQWYKNGASLLGATSSSYVLSNVQPSNAGTYTITVSNGTLPNATSTGAVLTVNVAPSITMQPKSSTLTVGQNDTLSVAATGTAPLSYQWYKNGTAITGATSLSYVLTNVQPASAATYTVVVSNVTQINTTSSSAVLTVNVPPSITTQPKSSTLIAGQNDTLSVTATGTAPLSYQWYKNGTAITGATSLSYVLTNVQPANAATYTVVVSNVTQINTTSSSAVLTVNVPPSITTQPKSSTLIAGQNDTLSVTAAGTAPLSYQWYKNGTAITGATSLTYVLTNVQPANAATYTVVVSNVTQINVTSSGAVLTVNVPPSITTQPKSSTLVVGQNDTLSVTAAGTAPLSYQWYKNGTSILGATSSSYSLTNVQTNNTGTYTVTVSNGTPPKATSTGAVLTVNPAPVAPSITVQPKSDTVTVGQNAIFTVTATGTTPLIYSWLKNGTAIPKGTSPSCTLSNVQFSDSGTYTVTVTNVTTQTVTSAPAILKVNPAPVAPSISVQPQSQTVIAGQNVIFSVKVTGTAPLSYQWNKNGTPIPKGTSPSCTLSNVQFSDSGTYTVTVTNVTTQIVISAPAILKVNPAPVAPSISVQPQSQTVTAGQNVTFIVTASGTPTPMYQWSKDGGPISGANSSSYSITGILTSDAATYTVTVSNGILPDATSGGAVLTVNNITLQPLSATVNVGDNVTFTATTTGAAPNSFQWYEGGVAIQGATSSSYSITNVQTTDAGNYYVTESNGTSPDPQSNSAILTVNQAGSQ